MIRRLFKIEKIITQLILTNITYNIFITYSKRAMAKVQKNVYIIIITWKYI